KIPQRVHVRSHRQGRAVRGQVMGYVLAEDRPACGNSACIVPAVRAVTETTSLTERAQTVLVDDQRLELGDEPAVTGVRRGRLGWPGRGEAGGSRDNSGRSGRH